MNCLKAPRRTLAVFAVFSRTVGCHKRSTAVVRRGISRSGKLEGKKAHFGPWYICRRSLMDLTFKSKFRIQGGGEIERERLTTNAGLTLGLTHMGVQWLVGIGIFALCVTASIFLITAVSALKDMQHAARRVSIVMKLMELEMPETMAAVRLSSLEISDCIEEFSGLGSDLASGLRSSANLLTAAERGVRQSTEAIRSGLLPVIQSKAPEARSTTSRSSCRDSVDADALEEFLRERAMLHQHHLLQAEAVHETSNRIKAIRKGVASLGIGMKAAQIWKSDKQS